MSMKTLQHRLAYHGGPNQIARMNIDKLKSLKRAMKYSYQAATAILSDGREFRCLINPDKINADLDNKVLSIPFKGVCLNRPFIPDAPYYEGEWEDMKDLYEKEYPSLDIEAPREIYKNPLDDTWGEVATNIKEGDVIEWKETKSHWLVYLQRLEETAYFRADLRRCRYQIELDNGSKYWISIKGPSEGSIDWEQKSNNYFNKLNHTIQMFITQNKETMDYFHRFNKIMINSEPWEVQGVDSISMPGILEVHLKETYNNTPETDIDAAVHAAIDVIEIDEKDETYIHGPNEVYPYEVHEYQLKNYIGEPGIWKLVNMSRKNMAKLMYANDTSVNVNILTGKSGDLELVYETAQGEVVAALNIKIKSL